MTGGRDPVCRNAARLQLPDCETIMVYYDKAASTDGTWKSHIISHGMLSWLSVMEKHCCKPFSGGALPQGTPIPPGRLEKELIVLIANLLEVI